jgi:tRNA-specific 2-thiouridylase
LGTVDLKEFLKHFIKEKRGKVLNENGKEIGFHDGVVFHTLGERHGFTVTEKNPNDGPYYIIGKDVKKNILYVSQEISPCQGGVPEGRGGENSKPLRSRDHLPFAGEEIRLEDVNWILEIPKPNKNYSAQIRYHGELLPCRVEHEGTLRSRRAKIIFQKPVLVASGQSVVVYDKDICLGGGVVV